MNKCQCKPYSFTLKCLTLFEQITEPLGDSIHLSNQSAALTRREANIDQLDTQHFARYPAIGEYKVLLQNPTLVGREFYEYLSQFHSIFLVYPTGIEGSSEPNNSWGRR